MLCYLPLLPESIYPLIRDYLFNYDGFQLFDDYIDPKLLQRNILSWRNFLNSSKTIFHHPHSNIKSNNIFYNLNEKYSEGYLCFETDDNDEFMQKIVSNILEIIQDPFNQIGLNTGRILLTPWHFSHIKCHAFAFTTPYSGTSRSSDLPSLEGSLTLLDCEKFNDFTRLQGLQYLRLTNALDLTNLSGLSTLRSLYLCDCNTVTDVSMLGNLRYLMIDSCRKVRDVSGLGNVHTLYLKNLILNAFLPEENEVNVLTCSINYLPQLVMFTNKHQKTLCLLEKVEEHLRFDSLRGWKEMDFSINQDIGDKSMPFSGFDTQLAADPQHGQLPPVQRLTLTSSVISLDALSTLQYLKLHQCEVVKEVDFLALGQLKRCWFDRCLLSSVQIRGSIQVVTITSHRSDNINISIDLSRFQWLHIEDCKYFGRIQVVDQSQRITSFLKLIGSDKFEIV